MNIIDKIQDMINPQEETVVDSETVTPVETEEAIVTPVENVEEPAEIEVKSKIVKVPTKAMSNF